MRLLLPLGSAFTAASFSESHQVHGPLLLQRIDDEIPIRGQERRVPDLLLDHFQVYPPWRRSELAWVRRNEWLDALEIPARAKSLLSILRASLVLIDRVEWTR